MDVITRFSPLVRKGLRFRDRFEQAKRSVEPVDFEWYPYDSFVNLFPIQNLLRSAERSIEELAADRPVLDAGAGDGALSLFLESLGHRVHAIDSSGTNMNRMLGIRKLAAHFQSQIRIQDIDIDGRFELTERYGLAMFLGALYHLKNPWYALETIAGHARFCLLSTRVARFSPDRQLRLDAAPVAYLLDPAECNFDTTNYWIFSPPGLLRLCARTGWAVRGAVNTGAAESDTSSQDADERMFLLLESER